MKALVYGGPGARSWTDVPNPAIKDPEDAIVRVDAVTICGTDLHILKGDVPEVETGRILGHEAVGTVVEVGSHVRDIEVGQRVLISCISACGRCRYCREGRYGQCLGGGGWVLGHTIDGTQAELVRVPFADRSLYVVPEAVSSRGRPDARRHLPDVVRGGRARRRRQPGDFVVIVGAGPIGLAAVAAARLFTPSQVMVVDPAASRRERALAFGADLALSPDDPVQATILELTDGRGADVAIEAVGIPSTFELCTEVCGPAATSRTSGSMAQPPPCTSSGCGSATSRSRRVWSTPGPPPCSSGCSRRDTCRSRHSAPTGSTSMRWRRPMTSSPGPKRPTP